jgi:WD40 repeat protein
LLASSGDGPTIWLWEAKTGKPLGQISTAIDGHASIHALAFSPDGKMLASAGSKLCLWAVDTGKLVRQLGKDDQNLWSVAFASDGKTLACCGQDPCVHLWDPRSGKELHTLAGHDKEGIVDQVTFSPDNKTVASASTDRTVRTWDVASGKALDVYRANKPCCAVAYSPESKILAFGDWEGGITLQETKPHGKRRRIDAKGHPPTSFSFSPDGSVLAAGAEYSTIRLWNPATGKECEESSAIPRGFGRGVWLPKTRTLALWCTYGNAFHLWNVEAGKPRDPGAGHFARVDALAVTPDGKTVASSSFDRAIRLWERATGRPLRCWTCTWDEQAYALACSPDGKFLAAAGEDAIVRIRDLATGKEIKQIKTTLGRIWSLSYSADGRTLYAGGYFVVEARDVETGAARGQFGERPKQRAPDIRSLRIISQVIPSPDGRYLLTSERRGRRDNSIWDICTRTAIRLPNYFEGWTGTTALSPDGRTLAAVRGRDEEHLRRQEDTARICLWETATGKERLLLPDKTLAGPLAFSPDGRVLATASAGGDLVLVDLATGKEVRRFKGTEGITHLLFAPDGKVVLTAGLTGSMLVWDLSNLPRLKAIPKASKEQLVEAWTDLAAIDAGKGYRAIWTLAASADGVALLRQRLRPVPTPTAELLDRLIHDLDSDNFSQREAAMASLRKIAEAAAPTLRKALQGKPSAEVKRRLTTLLEKVDHDNLVAPTEALQSLRGVEALERNGSPEARKLLQDLARGAPEARLTREAKASLDRLGSQSR